MLAKHADKLNRSTRSLFDGAVFSECCGDTEEPLMMMTSILLLAAGYAARTHQRNSGP